MLSGSVGNALIAWHVKHFQCTPPVAVSPVAAVNASKSPLMEPAAASAASSSAECSDEEGEYILELNPEWAERMRAVMERRAQSMF
jgi:hypothetical protein